MIRESRRGKHQSERERRGALDVQDREAVCPRQAPPLHGQQGPDAEIFASVPVEEAQSKHDLSA